MLSVFFWRRHVPVGSISRDYSFQFSHIGTYLPCPSLCRDNTILFDVLLTVFQYFTIDVVTDVHMTYLDEITITEMCKNLFKVADRVINNYGAVRTTKSGKATVLVNGCVLRGVGLQISYFINVS